MTDANINTKRRRRNPAPRRNNVKAQEIVNRLGGRWNGSSGTCRCPAHDDSDPSLSISEGRNGCILVKCHAGCSQQQVIDALRARDLWPASKSKSDDGSDPDCVPYHKHYGHHDNIWHYHDARGRVIGAVCRYEEEDGKKIAPWKWNRRNRKWIQRAMDVPRPLYRLPNISRTDKPVLVVEGEKAANVARRIIRTHVVTTWPGGSGAVDKVDLQPLASRDVVLWPDADEAGRKAMQRLGQRLLEVGARPHMVELPDDLPSGFDLANKLPKHLDSAALIEQAVPVTASEDATEDATDDEEIFERLAALSATDYDRVRKEEAEALGIRTATLDDEVKKRRPRDDEPQAGQTIRLEDPEPWDEAVEGSGLLTALSAAIRRHVVLSQMAADASALWAVHTHALDAAQHSPVLGITSPTPECGKSTMLATLDKLTRRAMHGSNITPSATFRAIDKWQPTLLVDEADTFLRYNEELRGVFDSSHSRAGAFVIKSIPAGDGYDVGYFSTWTPKAIATIGDLPATITSRTIPIQLDRMKSEDRVRALREGRMEHLERLKRKTARFADDHLDELRVADPAMPDSLHGRAADNWRPLLAIADVAGGEWPERARRAAEALSARLSEQTYSIMLLEDIRTILEEEEVDRMESSELVEKLAELEGRPWPEFGKGGKPITPNKLARLLGHFKIRPKQIWSGEKRRNRQGYQIEQFADAFARYLPQPEGPPGQTPRPLDARHGAAGGESKTLEAKVALGDGTPRKPKRGAASRGLGVENPRAGARARTRWAAGMKRNIQKQRQDDQK